MKAALLLFLFCVAEADDLYRTVHALQDKVNLLEEQLKSSQGGQDADMASRLSVSETKIEELQTRLSESEKLVEELHKHKTEMAAKLTASETQMDILKNRLSSSDNQLQLLQLLQRSSVNNIDALKKQCEAHVAQLSTVETRLSNTDDKVEKLWNKPQVAFSVGLAEGYVTGSSDSTLVYKKVFTNIGNAYNPSTGIFTCPVKGAYHFRFTAALYGSSQNVHIQMHKNDQMLMYNGGYNNHPQTEYVSNGMIVELEERDTVFMRLPSGYRLYDNSNHNNMWSGVLVYPM